MGSIDVPDDGGNHPVMSQASGATWREAAKAMAMVSLPVIWPYMNFLNINRSENYSVSRLGLYGLGTLLTVWLGFFIFRAIFGKYLSYGRAAAIVAVGVISFFCYSLTYALADQLWQGAYLKTWAAFTVVMVSAAWYFSRSALFQNVIFVLGFVLAIVPTALYLEYQLRLYLEDGGHTAGQAMALSAENTARLPSVYHIILDEYGREDALQKIYGFDNSDFLQRLKERGFYVADKATSNYRATQLSIPSLMSMSYPFQSDVSLKDIENSKSLHNGGGPVFEFFQKSGYYTALMQYRGALCKNNTLDYCLSRSSFIYGELEKNFIAITPFNSVVDLILFGKDGLAETKYNELWDIGEFITGIQTEKSLFAHIHVLMPHGPHRFTKTCEDIRPAQQEKEGKLKAYIENLQCSNMASLELVDTILERDPDAIIILQSDHGPRIGVNWTDWRTNDAWEESFSILNAWLIPPDLSCRKELHPELTLVNTFRIVLGCVTETTPDLLPIRWFDGDKIADGNVEILRN
jgi:hypothetical protein